MGNWQPRYYKPDKPANRVVAENAVEGSENVEKPEATPEELASVLHVTDLDFNIPENTTAHHTDKFDCTKARDDSGFGTEPMLVVRRGQPFTVDLTFDREFSLENDDLVIMVKTGPKPELSASTYCRFEIDESGESKYKPLEWCGKLLKKSGKTASVEIHVDADCAVGKWNLTVITKSKVKGEDKPKVFLCEDTEEFIVLFNPWCKDDPVYMDDDKLLEEYVLNDQGAVFKGQGHFPKGKAWNFGQFEDGVVNICLWLVQKCFKKSRHGMSDPVQVSRVIAQVVNCNDADEGVLVGNWSGDYADGESPSNWYGSVRILNQYWKTKESVKYGQCWVFSGLTTTVCRALGLPCRSITNYSSAHDGDETNVIEKYYERKTENGVQGDLEFLEGDSVWNFHVWNECWMKRPDINSATGCYDGWQVIDGTPQERSEGVFTCGPAPLKAIKEGNVKVKYDAHFVFAEVNADEICLEKIGSGWKKFKISTDKIGKSISTKIPDGKKFDTGAFWNNRLDLTEEYKHPEGSQKNRNAVMNAAIGAKNVSEFYTGGSEQKDDVEFKLIHAEQKKVLGKDIEVKLTAKNISEYRKTLANVRFRFLSMKYTGEMGNLIKADQQKINEELKPGKVYEYPCKLTCTEYLSELDDSRSMCIQAFATVEGSRTRPGQDCIKSHEVVLIEPDVDVEMPNAVDVGDEFEARLTIENPLAVELTNCTAGYEGRGFPHVTAVKQDNVPAGGTGVFKFKLTGKTKGTFRLVFKFSSNELQHLSGAGEITIR